MKERNTIRKLMQGGWIPVLTGILSAGIILSTGYTTGKVYLMAFLLMALYFVAMAANRVNAKVIVAATAKRILQQVIPRIKEVLQTKGLGRLIGNVLSLRPMPMDLAKHRIGESIAALNDGFSCLMAGIDTGDMLESLKKSKIALDKLIQSFKSVA